MITEIGIVAGEIWQHLEKKPETTLAEVKKSLKKDKDIILMSLGWLAREGHIIIEKTAGGYKIFFNRKI